MCVCVFYFSVCKCEISEKLFLENKFSNEIVFSLKVTS